MTRPFLLIVTRHYPPEISGGARRPYLLAQGLRSRGYRVAVASPFAPVDEPDWIRTPHPAAERGRIQAERSDAGHEAAWKPWLRRMVRWPDNEIAWAGRAADAVLASGFRPDWVLTTSPPESAHAAGERLKRSLGVRWLLEFRDSWIEEPLRRELLTSGLRQTVERRIARRWLRAADARIAVSEALASEMQRLGPNARSPLSVVGHFADPPASAIPFDGPGPHLLHAGSFSLSHGERRLGRLLAAFEVLRETLPSSARLHLAGRLTAQERQELSEHAVASFTVPHGEVPYTTSRALQAGADGLIVFQQGVDALPGKLSEYLECTAPILTLGEGTWKGRLATIPHWPLEAAAAAFAAARRAPANSFPAALDAYEQLING